MMAIYRRLTSEFHFRFSDSPIPTVEINRDDFDKAGYMEFGTLIGESIGRYAADNQDIVATIYVYPMTSVNFGDYSNVEFFGVVGNKKREILEKINSAFIQAGVRRDSKIRTRYGSDYVSFEKHWFLCHVEDGKIWFEEEEGYCYTDDRWLQGNLDGERSEPGGQNQENDNENDKDAVSKDEWNGEQERSYRRQVRSDAKVETVTRRIEQEYGLPQGSVALIKPDKKRFRADTRISKVRQSWNK